MTEAQWNAYHQAHGTTPTGTYDQYAAKRGLKVDPYRDLPDWARTQIGVMGTDEATHVAQAQKAAQWLASVTTPLANMRAGQDQAFAGNLNAIAGAYTAAGAPGVTPGQSTSPGGFGPSGSTSLAPLGAAAAQAATVGPGSQALLSGQYLNARLGDVVSEANRYATQLPSKYAKQRDDYILKIQQWRAEQDQAFLLQTLKATGASTHVGGYAPGTAAPPGYVAVQRSDGGVNFVPDKTYTTPAQATAAAAKAAAVGKPTAAQTAAYKSLRNQWAKAAAGYDTATRTFKPKAGPGTLDMDPKSPTYGQTIPGPSTGGEKPGQFFERAIVAGLKPYDALQIVSAGGVAVNTVMAYQWLRRHVGTKRARLLAIRFTGEDPLRFRAGVEE